jgi:uncharacterized damage-inducible protein DinB
MHRECLSLVALLLCASSALAQTPAEDLYTDAARRQYAYIQDLVMRSAEKAPDDVFGFKPTPEVRSFAGVLGHIADANMLLCRIAAGQTDVDAVMKDLPSLQVHEKKTTKTDLVAALKESRAFCEGELAKTTDASGRQTVKWFGNQQMPKLSMFALVTSHGWEHYGNLVTYMRLKGVVPPSSEQQPPPPSR